jgi:hypothetical protein
LQQPEQLSFCSDRHPRAPQAPQAPCNFEKVPGAASVTTAVDHSTDSSVTTAVDHSTDSSVTTAVDHSTDSSVTTAVDHSTDSSVLGKLLLVKTPPAFHDILLRLLFPVHQVLCVGGIDKVFHGFSGRPMATLPKHEKALANAVVCCKLVRIRQ